MAKQGILTKILAIAGTVLVWLPILAPVVLSTVVLIADREFLFDYLMPAELFPLVLVGGGLLLWAALRMHTHVKFIAWTLGSAVGLLVFSQGLAVLTGLANGRVARGGWQEILVTVLIGGYALAVVGLGISGILLLRDLFRPAPQT